MANNIFGLVLFFVILVALYRAEMVIGEPQERIINGNKASKNQFPWHVLLNSTKSDNTKKYCGGTLIAPNFVLTAASCIENATNIKVDVGIISFHNPTETQNSSVYRLHSEYDYKNGLNDIAIIKLDKNFTYRDNVRPITLPGKSQANSSFVYQQCYFAGFGMIDENPNMSIDLKYSSNVIASNDYCKENLDRENIRVCAVSFESSVCYGDQGGGLVFYTSRWFQVGLLTHINQNGCNIGAPHVYTRITDHLEWIAWLTGLNFDY